MDYKATLNMGETEFPMRGNLPEREPKFLAQWSEENLYQQRQAKNKGKTKFILHDGPPYANGNIHIGTALNKILKDIIVKYKGLCGYDAPYVPGWDTHGLPIEHAAIKILGLNRHELDPLTLRNECQRYALQCLDMQREDFKRLGVAGEWDNPYITLAPHYEAQQIRVFGEMALQGHIYKGLKTVYWCTSCETALAEAEIEYAEKKSHAIYVKFPLADDKGVLPGGINPQDVYAVIWTTTPWTLPANVAIAVHADYEYAWVEFGSSICLIAVDLLPQVAESCGIKEYRIVATTKGKELAGMTFAHPFLERESVVVLADYVTLEQGTGCVHTAPGHGQEDFETGMKYKLPILNPVDHSGRFTAEAGQFKGMTVEDANVPIIKELASRSLLLGKGSIRHQYAHCWRCKSPIIYRATEQWFASVDGFRQQALAAITNVQWIPTWGEDRIHNMVADRNDWCISRQRVWGVPIPIFYCLDCGEPVINRQTIDAVADLFAKEGSDAWWKYEAAEILPAGTACGKCGHGGFRKESDIMDVWFDSGSSHAAVLEQNERLSWPADLYLEGSDQHRGWFQSSLLTSVATKGVAPYRAVLTHGFVVDGEGRKMSKSIGNVIYPQEVIKQYGADILRLWVASSDYQSDIRISKEIIKQMSEVYRKIRNTFRFMLMNLYDFQQEMMVDEDQLTDLDRWALWRWGETKQKIATAYNEYEFHTIYHTAHNFCAVDLSSLYLDVLKDRLYTERGDSATRRAAQTVLYRLTRELAILLSPILVFTAEEVWQHLPDKTADSVHLEEWPAVAAVGVSEEFCAKWTFALDVRTEITKALEVARRDKVIGHSLEANVKLYGDTAFFGKLQLTPAELTQLCIVSGVEYVDGLAAAPAPASRAESGEFAVEVVAAKGEKCERCWMFSETVGSQSNHTTLCQRCAAVMADQ